MQSYQVRYWQNGGQNRDFILYQIFESNLDDSKYRNG